MIINQNLTLSNQHASGMSLVGGYHFTLLGDISADNLTDFLTKLFWTN